MIERLLLKLRARDMLSAAEEAALLALIDHVEEVPAKKVAVPRGVPLRHSVLLLDGLMCRFKDLKNGRRQISALHIPGDFLDLHGFTLKYLDHDVMALAKSHIVLVPHDRLTQMTIDFPHLTRLLWFSTNLDAAIHREWEVSLGQRSGVERVAHLFSELHTRMSVVGLVDGNVYDLPMSQAELGECLGLTPVHTNRVLRNLRERGLAEMKARQVVIHDMSGLKALAEFDPLYLYLDRSPR